VHGMSEAAYRYWVGLPVPDNMLQVQQVTDEAMRVRIAAVCYISTDGSFKRCSSGGKHICANLEVVTDITMDICSNISC